MTPREQERYREWERTVCRILYELPEGHSMTRLSLGEKITGQTGSTLLASVLGTLRGKGLVEVRPCAFGEKGARYRLTDRGVHAYELIVALDEFREETA